MNHEIKTTLENINKGTSLFIEPAKRRMENPFISSFVISFICLNWRPIVYIFASNKSIEDKFHFITLNYYGHQWGGTQNWFMYLIFPMVISFFYMLALPLILNWTEKIVHFTGVNRSRREHIINYKKHKNLTDIAWAQFKAEEARTGFLDRKKLNEDLKNLTNQLKNKDETNNILTEEVQKLKDNIHNLSSKNNELKSHSNYLETELVTANNNLTNSERSNKQQLDQIKEKNETIGKLQLNIQNLENTNNNINIELISSKQQITNLENNLTIYKNDLESAHKHTSNISRQLQDFQMEIHNKNETVNNLNDQNQHLESRLNDVEQELNNYRHTQTNINLTIESLANLQYLFSELNPQDLYNYTDLDELFVKMQAIINDLTHELSSEKQPNFLLRFSNHENLSFEYIISSCFNIGVSLDLNIKNVYRVSEDQYEIQIDSRHEETVLNFMDILRDTSNINIFDYQKI